MDRTNEFLGIAEACRAAVLAQPGGSPRIRPTARIPARTALFTHTQTLARAIKRVTDDVAHLTRLAQRKTLFDDPAAEINSLTMSVKSTLSTLDKAMKELHAHIPPSRSTASSASKAVDAHAHWGAVAHILHEHLQETTQAFQAALTLRSETLKAQAARRRALARSTWAPLIDESNALFTQHGAPAAAASAAALHAGNAPHPSVSSGAAASHVSALPPHASPPMGNGGGLRRRAQQQSHKEPHAITHAPFAAHSGAASVGAAPATPPRSAPALASGSVLVGGPVKIFSRAAAAGALPYGATASGATGPAVANAYAAHVPESASTYMAAQLASARDAATRASEMKGVERSIAELGQMFTRMSALVAEQGETVDRIDQDMDVTLDNVNAGVSELQKYYRAMKGNTALMLKVFAVLILVIVLVGIFRRS